MNQEEIIAKHYDAVAQQYDGVNQLVDRFLSKLREVPFGSNILDIGCGTGNLTLRLPEANSFARVVGVDISEGVLQIARKHAQDALLDNFEFLHGSAVCLPFDEGKFDVAVSNIVFHLVPDRLKCLREIIRVLKPGGLAMLQFLGGAPSAFEMMEIMQRVWNEVLPGTELENLLYRVLVDDVVTVELMEKYLNDIGIKRFEIAWRRNVISIPKADVAKGLGFIELIGGFWRHGLDKEVADCIANRVAEAMRAKAISNGQFRHTVNHLLVEFMRPDSP